jgi:hypothetical protein
LAAVWERSRVTVVTAAVWGALVMGAATATEMLFHVGQSPVEAYASYLRGRDFPGTLWSMAFGRVGVVLYAGTVAIALRVLWRAAREDTNGCSPLA